MSDIILPDCMMGPSDPCAGYDQLYAQLEALKKENEELRKERDLFRHNLNKYAPNKKYQEALDDIAKLRGGV